MSRIYKTVSKMRTWDELDEIRCDLCGAIGEGGKWERGIWRVDETTVEVAIHQREGESYPEGGSGTEYVIDLCPTCFVNRLIPWLRSEGADIKQAEWDW